MYNNHLSFLSGLLLIGTTTIAIISGDAAADPVHTTVIQSVQDELPFDGNDRLAKHTFVYDASSPLCKSMVPKTVSKRLLTTPFETNRYDIVGVDGDAFDKIFGPYSKVQAKKKADGSSSSSSHSGCLSACIQRGVPKELATAVMPESIYDSTVVLDDGNAQESLTDWFGEHCSKVEICMVNYHSRESPLEVYWKDPANGELKAHISINFGERHTRCFNSYIGHEFVARDESDPNNLVVVGELTVEFATVKAFGDSPPSDERAPAHDFEKEIESTLRYEWARHQKVKRTFSPLGFKKGKLPPDVFALTSAFYYNNAQNVVREEWKSKGVFVNWWETDVLFLQLPWKMKERLQERLLHMVEEWAGVPVEQTVMYGLRQYTSGARLLTHVDRTATHAVSLIVNIAQGNLTEPWPVEVQDHADRIHEVTMEPGDVVYYESAKCLHGRNRPLMGKNAYYVNLFTHYRPVREGDWWLEENPEGTPEPVLGDKLVIEECHVDTVNGSNSTPIVKCNNPALGQHISRDLFQAKEPDDLIKWWRMTGPKGVGDDEGRHVPNANDGEL